MKAKGIATVVIAALVLAACGGGEKEKPVKKEEKIYLTDDQVRKIAEENLPGILESCYGNLNKISNKEENASFEPYSKKYPLSINRKNNIFAVKGSQGEIKKGKENIFKEYECSWDFNTKSLTAVKLVTENGEYKKDLIPIDESCKKTPSCLAEKLVPALNNQCKKAIEESYSDLYGEKMVFPDSVDKIHYTNTNWDTLDTEKKGVSVSGGSMTIQNAAGEEEKVEYGCIIDSVYQNVMSGWALVRDKDTVTDIAVCKQDPACMAKKYQPVFDADCRTLIEALAEKSARYEYKIEYGLLTSPYSRVKFADKKKSILELYGNKIKFQNGFGAWQKVGYVCRFDINKKQVTGVKFVQ